MKPAKLALIIALALMAAPAIPLHLAAQGIQDHQQTHHHYKLIDLGTFGGQQSYVYAPNNYAAVLNNRGSITGWAETTISDPFPTFCFTDDCLVAHAFQSQGGHLTDLGALREGFSSASGWISANGLIAGWSENGDTDPTFFGVPVVHGVLWKNGAIKDLATLNGGYESAALAVNSKGQVVGAADNDITDATPISSDVYGWGTQTRAFLWQNGVMRDLGTLGGTDAVAFLVNERGQIVGVSYTDSNPSSYCGQNLQSFNTTGAFLWENGVMTNLGSFGGTCTFASNLNNRGEIVGLSTTTGDQFQHAFLWKDGSFSELPNANGGNNSAGLALNEGGAVAGFASLPGNSLLHAALWKAGEMTDLGTVDEDLCSNGYSINSRQQVVGVSVPTCDFDTTRAFLWENGSIADLNALIPADSSLYLTAPDTINDRGEIAGVGVDANGNQHAFLLIPCGRDDTDCQDAGYPAFRPAPNITKRPGSQKGLRRMFRTGSRPISGVSSVSTPSAPDAVAPIDRRVADEAVNETGSAGPILSESLEADLMPRFKTSPSVWSLWDAVLRAWSLHHLLRRIEMRLSRGSTRVGDTCE